MRALAASVAEERPHVVSVCEIEPGDALAFATRFAMQWAYRGHQALFWSEPFQARRVRDLYLPAVGAIAFERRGFLYVEAEMDGRSCVLAATQFSEERRPCIAEIRFARGMLRGAQCDAILCAHLRETRIAFGDLGFREEGSPAQSPERVYVRGFEKMRFTLKRAAL